ncbi:chorismate mutase [Clostridium magnum]|uniref:chorismate mutase n=1 Tax=Clostridium magnum TaxID=33954 RepID=UPI00082D8A7F
MILEIRIILEELSILREKIDKVDKELVKLFQERMELACKVAEYKKNNSMEILNIEREEQVIKKQLRNLEDKSIAEETEAFFRNVMSISRSLQRKIIDDNNVIFNNIVNKEARKNEFCIVGFQGDAGSFSQEALTEYFSANAKALNFQSFKDVFEALKRGDIQYGVLPVKNSSTEVTTEIYNLLMEYGFYIIGEKSVRIEQELLADKNVQTSDVEEVYLNKQAVYHNNNNYTTLMVIAPKFEVGKDCNKVSIVITLPDEVGILHNITNYFYKNNLSMTKIESRPVVDKPWEYFFYIDFYGNVLEEDTKNAIKAIENKSTYFKLLGNFKSEKGLISMEEAFNNIVLIGMPGCGKTTIGKIIAEKLNRKFIDIDEYIEKTNNATIPEIFKNGEKHFRMLESKAVEELSKETNAILATGGGVIKNQENIEKLAKNGLIIFVDRPVDQIVSDVEIQKRPLLKDGIKVVYQLFNERYDLYIQSSHLQVYNSGSLNEIVEKISDICK